MPVCLLEEHSLHLPLMTDAFISESVANSLADKISKDKDDISVLILPLIPLGFDCLDLTGSLPVKESTLTNVVIDVIGSIARYSFKYFIISTFHGGTENHSALNSAIKKLKVKFNINILDIAPKVFYRMFTVSSKYKEYFRKYLGRELSREEVDNFKKDLHAGFIETSCLLYLKPSLVRNNYKNLKPYIIDVPPIDKTLSHEENVEIYKKSENDKKFDGHWGYPSKADKKFGKILYSFLVDESLSTVKNGFKELFY